MPRSSFEPDRGDFVWVNFSPTQGHEQAGKRPALVLSPRSYNAKTGLMLCCPITSQVKGYPFEQKLPDGMKLQGVVLCDQVRSVDWRARQIELIGTAPRQLLENVLGRIVAILGAG